MLFNSLEFLFFFVCVYGLYLLVSHRWQNRLLLVASYFFYGCWDWRFLSLILGSTIVNFLCGCAIFGAQTKGEEKLIFRFCLAVNLGLLGFFKYYNFFADSLSVLLNGFGFKAGFVDLNIILPIGISFYTFQAMSYTIDIYKKELEPEDSFADFALFVSFFPQLVAGPIERASRLLPQITRKRRVTEENLKKGLWLIAWGFLLKVFMADNLSVVSDNLFLKNTLVNGWDVLLGVYAFAFQIFGDFAGYSSIAIGIGKLMGFDLKTNFLFPYFIQSPVEFWRHWHISLSEWLRDYLYIPLGGNQGSAVKTCRNLGVTMFLAGLWHGAAWTYVLWGLYHGGLLVLHRLWAKRFSSLNSLMPGKPWLIFKVVVMFHAVCLGWLIFRSESFTQLATLLQSLTNFSGLPSTLQLFGFVQLIFYTWLCIALQFIQMQKGDIYVVLRFPLPAQLLVAMMLYLTLVFWGEFGGREFVYFQF